MSYFVVNRSDTVAPVDDQLDVLLEKAFEAKRVVVLQRIRLDVSGTVAFLNPLDNTVVNLT